MCGSILVKLFKDKLETSKRNRFIQFKSYTLYQRNKDTNLSVLTIRSFMGKLRSAISKWSRFTEKMREIQAREDLATEFAAALVRGKYFSALKEYTKLKSQERQFGVFKEEQADKVYQLSVLNEFKRYTQKKRERDSVLKKMVKR